MLRTHPYRITRAELARAATIEYVRSYWPVLIGVPVFGLIAVSLGGAPLLRYIGGVCLLWPLSIPARSIMVTRKSARTLGRETAAILDGDALYFENLTKEGPPGLKLKLSSVKKLQKAGELYLIKLRKPGFVLIPQSAFKSDEDRAAFEQALQRT